MSRHVLADHQLPQLHRAITLTTATPRRRSETRSEAGPPGPSPALVECGRCQTWRTDPSTAGPRFSSGTSWSGPPRPAHAGGSGKDSITPVEGLSALSLDALTSVAYGPEAIILVLAVAGAGALHLVLPITDRHRRPAGHPRLLLPPGDRRLPGRRRRLRRVAGQPRHQRQPGGGGRARRRLHAHRRGLHRRRGGVAAARPTRASTGPPSRCAWASSLLITLLNLRGLGETARAFLLPTMVFIVGPARHHRRRPHPPARPATRRSSGKRAADDGLKAVTVLLVLKAFSAGCSALTGVEAIANGVPLFREPRAVRAKRTEMLLGLILGAMLLGPRRPGQAMAHRPSLGPDRAQPDHGHGRRARAGPTTSSPSRSRSCWPWRPTPPSAGSPSSPAWWRGTTTCPTSSASAATARSSPTGSSCSPCSRARSSSPSTATPTR